MRKLPKDELYRLHVEEFCTYQDLAIYFNCSTQTVRYHLDKYKIPRLKKGTSLGRKLKKNEEELFQFLKHLYVDKNMSTYKIAEMLDSTQYTIWRYIKRLGISTKKGKGNIL